MAIVNSPRAVEWDMINASMADESDMYVLRGGPRARNPHDRGRIILRNLIAHGAIPTLGDFHDPDMAGAFNLQPPQLLTYVELVELVQTDCPDMIRERPTGQM
jgi:hypothetical protein